MPYGAILKIAIPLAIGLVIGLAINAWRYGADIAELKADHAVELKRISDTAAEALQAALRRQADAENRAAEIDVLRTEELANAQAENDRLRNAVADGERRLRIKATCPASPGGVPGAAPAAGLAPSEAVELDREAEQAVFDLRSDLIRDRAMILGLQDYVRDVCRR